MITFGGISCCAVLTNLCIKRVNTSKPSNFQNKGSGKVIDLVGKQKLI